MLALEFGNDNSTHTYLEGQDLSKTFLPPPQQLQSGTDLLGYEVGQITIRVFQAYPGYGVFGSSVDGRDWVRLVRDDGRQF